MTVLAGAAVIASIGFGVQPFRQAILQASTSLTGNGNGNTDVVRGSAATEGTGTPSASVIGCADGPSASHAKRR